MLIDLSFPTLNPSISNHTLSKSSLSPNPSRVKVKEEISTSASSEAVSSTVVNGTEVALNGILVPLGVSLDKTNSSVPSIEVGPGTTASWLSYTILTVSARVTALAGPNVPSPYPRISPLLYAVST